MAVKTTKIGSAMSTRVSGHSSQMDQIARQFIIMSWILAK